LPKFRLPCERGFASDISMATGLLALLDDVAAIAKVAASSLDDTVAAAGKASAKAAGVVIDDAAVTPRYVHGFAADRELPIVAKIAWGSVKNKLVLLLPGALLLSWLLPGAITPLLMAGGAYLCFEGAEKVIEIFNHSAAVEAGIEDGDGRNVEDAMVKSAIRTDLILSGEIMAITLASVAELAIFERAIVLAIVGIGITALVYGAVALIVKADDAGLALARTGSPSLRLLGRGMVAGMPVLLKTLAGIGTTAMLWVGGGIIVHGLETFGIAEPAHSIHEGFQVVAVATGAVGPVLGWLAGALAVGIIGMAIGGVIVAILHLRPGQRGGH
jgi:predicted DNA repair protein MutK